MAKPIPKVYQDIIAEYQLGNAGVTELARKYKIKRGTLAAFISKNNIRVSNNLKSGINAIKGGLMAINNEIQEITSGELSNDEANRRKIALMKGFEALEAYGDFGSYVVGLLKKGLKKGNDMLELAETPEQYSQVMRGIKTGVDALGIMPRTPLIAIQNNINSNMKAKKDNEIDIKVEFIKPKNKDDEIIEVEAK